MGSSPPVNGGYLLGIAVRAMQRVSSRPDPLTVSAYFLRPGQVGPAEPRVEQVRDGRRFVTTGAAVAQEGKEALRALANFGDLSAHEGLNRVDARPPDLPAVQECPDLADGREPDTLSLPALVDAGWPVVMEMGVRGSSTVELTVHVRARPAPGWLACRVGTRYVMNGMHEEDFEIWDSEGTLVAQSRQLAVLS